MVKDKPPQEGIYPYPSLLGPSSSPIPCLPLFHAFSYYILWLSSYISEFYLETILARVLV